MLNIYCIFHLNLAYSSIEEARRSDVIRRCYRPLLDLVRQAQVPLGIEASGYTLETISELDPGWIDELRQLLTTGRCEFIGSGYSQIIGPLAPAPVNDWNQKIGVGVYEDLLGFRPRIALVNEMAYSSGIVDSYLDNGYEAIVMEWNNPRKYHPEWNNEWRYFPQAARSASGRTIPLIWADSIAFQKFQRYAHQEYGLDEYMAYLDMHNNKPERYFPIYSNDAEIFDFRPGRYQTETRKNSDSEWHRISKLFQRIQQDDRLSLVPPSTVLKAMVHEHAGKPLSLESPEQPIPVKKQEKYNINRWALTGRNDALINTACRRIFAGMMKSAPENVSEKDWKPLCALWASDFRTHITRKRWDAYLEQLNCAENQWAATNPNAGSNFQVHRSKHAAPDAPLTVQESRQRLCVETSLLKCVFKKDKGLAIEGLWFKKISDAPLIGALPHGYYDDISLSADFFSGHVIIEIPGRHKVTDLASCRPQIRRLGPDQLEVHAQSGNGKIRMEKTYRFDAEKQSLGIQTAIQMPSRRWAIIHPLNITFMPTSFHQESLFYATHNGGSRLEKFRMGEGHIRHGQYLSALISSKHGLGATEGRVTVGDDKVGLCFQHNPCRCALIPAVHFIPLAENGYFLRLEYSAQEIDETFKTNSGEYDVDLEMEISPLTPPDILNS